MISFITGTNSEARRKKMYEMINSSSGNCYLVVPEQFTFESEKMLAKISSNRDANTLEALSFTRLCNYIFREGGGLAGKYSDDSTKVIIMGAALCQCGESLEYYKKNARSTSFISKLIDADSELKNAGITAADVRSIAERSDYAVLKSKTSDLATILETYDTILAKSWLDPLTDISRACDVLDSVPFFEGKCIFFESFSGFTGIEYRMIEYMMKQAKSVVFNICTDGYLMDHTGGTGLFSQTQKTAERLMSMARRLGVRILDPVMTHADDTDRSGAIEDIENCFHRCGSVPCHPNDGSVVLVNAHDPYDEAAFVACKIRELAEKGFRWRDMTVVARDLAIYSHAIPDAFEKAGIPLFMDKRSDVSSHPLAAFISASLSACRRGMDSADIMRILKTGILPVNEEDIAEFENYCYVWSIHGKQFLRDFVCDPSGYTEQHSDCTALLDRINSVRRCLCVPLGRLRDRIRDADGKAFASALYDYLIECNVPDGLKKLYAEYSDEGDVALAESLDSYWTYIIGAIDKYSTSLAGVSLGDEAMTRLFDLVLSNAKIGMVPQTLDSVAFGSADRIRMYRPKAVFVLGANEGVFPAKPGGSSLFTENERSEMGALGFDLSNDPRDFIIAERMHAFSIFTSPTDYLFVSRFEYDHKTKKQLPSPFIDRLRESLTSLPETDTSALPETFWLCSDEIAFDRLSSMGAARTPVSEALRKYFENSPVWAKRVSELGKRTDTSSLLFSDPKNAKALFGESINGAPTNIETYNSCPFRYYLNYGLRLREMNRAEISPMSSGNIIHYVLQKVISQYGGKGLSALTDRQLRDAVNAAMDEYLEIALGTMEGKTSKFRYQYGRLRQLLVKILKHVREEFRDSEFEPYAFEAKVGEGEIPVYDLTTPDGEKIYINGKIDRLDTLDKNGHRYVRIVDYKSGNKIFKLSDVYYGLNLQMLIYLFSTWNRGTGGLSGAYPAGVLYMPAGDKIITSERNAFDTEGAKKERESRCTNGLLIDDPSVLEAMEPGLGGVFIPYVPGRKTGDMLASMEQLGQIRRYVDSIIIKMSDELHAGKVGARPYRSGEKTSCDYCPYKEICRRTENDGFCEHRDIKGSEFYDLIKGGDDNG